MPRVQLYTSGKMYNELCACVQKMIDEEEQEHLQTLSGMANELLRLGLILWKAQHNPDPGKAEGEENPLINEEILYNTRYLRNMIEHVLGVLIDPNVKAELVKMGYETIVERSEPADM